MEAILFIGVQGSGKSSFYKERFYETHLRINRDMLKTQNRERRLIETCLELRQAFVIDNTLATRSERAPHIAMARAAGFRVIGYFFQVTTRQAIARNKERAGKSKVPVVAILGTYKRLEPPSPQEGFNELFVVTIGKDRQFGVSPAPDYSLEKAPVTGAEASSETSRFPPAAAEDSRAPG